MRSPSNHAYRIRVWPCGVLALVVMVAACISTTDEGADPTTYAVTGPASPGLEGYDRIITGIMAQYRIPGGAIAVARDGKLVLVRGYGLADVEAGLAVQPDALFRIASISKPITAVAIMKLVEDGRLRTSDRAFEILADLQPPADVPPDPRLATITIEHLLHHTAGWDRLLSFDPMFRPRIAAAALGVPPPADAETVIRYMLGQPLDFRPGSRVVYSNFGYTVLGRVIERVSGQPYEEFVRNEVLLPAGITRMSTARTRIDERAPDEVRYYVPGESFGRPLVTSVFPDEELAPINYGGFYIEAMDAHGGWIASAIDLVRFALATDGRASQPDVLQSESVEAMTQRTGLWTGSSYFIGFGWFIRPSGDDANWWHAGSLSGTSTILVRANTDFVWAAVFNARTDDGRFSQDIDQGMWDALSKVTAWPAHDLFGQY